MLGRRPLLNIARRAFRAFCITASTAAGDAPLPGRAVELVLREESRATLPEPFNISGISMGAGGDLLALSRSPNIVLRLTTQLATASILILPDSIVPLAAWSEGDRVEIVTASPPELHQLDPDGALLDSTPLELEGTLVAAARGDEGWHVLSDSTSGGGLRLHRIGDPMPTGVDAYGHLTLGQHGAVWLARTIYPYEARQFRRDRSRGLTLHPTFAPLDSMRAAAGQQDFASWMALPLVVLQGGYLQTIADIMYDRRLMIVYNEAGHVVATQVITAPLGLVVGDPRRKRVYGVRRTDRAEIVEYSYRWAHQGSGQMVRTRDRDVPHVVAHEE